MTRTQSGQQQRQHSTINMKSRKRKHSKATSQPPPPIKPAYYYGGNGSENSGVPVFQPSMEEFQDFNQFVSRIDEYGARAGIVKVIPPPEWKKLIAGSLSAKKLQSVRISNAIRQDFVLNNNGVYTQYNTVTSRKYSLQEWKQMSLEESYRPPSVYDRSIPVNLLTPKKKKENKDNRQVDTIQNANIHNDAHSSPPRSTPDILEESIPSLDEMLPFRFSHSNEDYFARLEKEYWKNLPYGHGFYGADVRGSLFDPDMKIWNVAQLDSILKKIRGKIHGVNTPYLYFGQYKATFAWHLEDMDLYSINYIHFGAPKRWYVVPTHQCDRFTDFLRSAYPHEYRNCGEFARHKMCVIPPKKLREHNFTVNECVQYEGEFILTFPYGYHGGFNCGYNCAESINFALPRWIDIGIKAKSCQCEKDTVKIDVVAIFRPHMKDPNPVRQCILCMQYDTGLIPVHDPEVQDAVEYDESVIYDYAHEDCAHAIPELEVEKIKRSVRMVTGLAELRKKRLGKLTCRFCKRKEGACVQCIVPSCVAAYHPKCAVDNGIVFRHFEFDDSDETEYGSLCHKHDPDSEMNSLQRNDQSLVDEVAHYIDQNSAKHRSTFAWVKLRSGGIRKGKLLEDFREKLMCVMDFDGYERAVSYLDISLKKPEDQIRSVG